jgi:hypothetical protein
MDHPEYGVAIVTTMDQDPCALGCSCGQLPVCKDVKRRSKKWLGPCVVHLISLTFILPP